MHEFRGFIETKNAKIAIKWKVLGFVLWVIFSIADLTIIYIYEVKEENHWTKNDILLLNAIATLLYYWFGHGDFTTFQMFNSMVLVPAFQFLIGLVAITSERKESFTLPNEFQEKQCVVRSTVEITSFMISIFSAFISSCILFMTIRTSIRKGKLCVLGDCTAPEYIIKKLIKLTDLEAIQYNQSNTSANDADDDDDIINNNTIQSSRTYEIYGFQLPMCLNEIKFRKAVERKRKKELKQDRLMSEIYSRMCKKNPVPAFSSNDMKILRDEYNEFMKFYARGSLYFNRVSVQCREKLNTSMDCPPFQHQNVLLGTRTICIVFYILFYLLLFSTFQSNNDSGEQELWKLPGNFLRNVLSIFHDVHTLTASLYPVLVFYITILISSIQSVMFFLLEKIRCGDVNKNYEYHLQVYSSMALKYAGLRYILGLKDEIGFKDGNINTYFWRFCIFAPFILLSSYMLIGYMCRIDKFYLWMKDRYSIDNVKDFKEKFPRLFYLVLLLGIGAFYGQLCVLIILKYF